ncbi:MAG: PEP-CTERM sorting domain-containing protein [Phycisphaerae bacterium]
MTDLNTLPGLPTGWTLTSGQAINNNGQIAVTATSGALTHTFVLSPISSRSAEVSSNPNGDPVVVSLNGGAATVGGVTAVFNISSGTFSADYSLDNPAEFSLMYPGINFDTTAGGSMLQNWNVHFSGALNDNVLVTFAYDPNLLNPATDESTLRIYHYVGGAWVLPANEMVDTASHTISFYTDSFSPFALGAAAAAPEPASLALLGMGAMLMTRRRIPRAQRMHIPTATSV